MLLTVARSVGAQKSPSPQNAGELYHQLSTVGLSKARLYRIRDAALDRDNVHIALQDGKIGFTEDVCGRITGAFFEGDGDQRPQLQ